MRTKRIHPNLEYPRTIHENGQYIGVLDRPHPQRFAAYAYDPESYLCQGKKLIVTNRRQDCFTAMRLHLAALKLA